MSENTENRSIINTELVEAMSQRLIDERSLMSRADSRQAFTLSQFKKEMKGIYSTSIRRDTLDESPMVYKPMSMILSQIEPTVDVIEQIRPVYNFKAGEK